jgi:16S rRNA (cytosine967-C5)-methyltransferase
VQDAAAAMPVKLFGELAGKHVADFCAAPGGKTMQLAQAGAEVTALDRSPNRIRRLSENLARVGLTATTLTADAAEWDGGGEKFDAILVDAPCTATGTIRRHPDVAWLKTPADMTALSSLQARLIRNASKLLKDGGTLIYCTCSLEPEEGEQAIAAILAEDSSLSRQPITPDELAGHAELITADGDLRTLPSHFPHEDARMGGLDGFYAARLRKTAT